MLACHGTRLGRFTRLGRELAYLSNPINKLGDRFGEFTSFAATRKDSRQIVQLSVEPLLLILERSTDDGTWHSLGEAVQLYSERLSPEQAARAGDASIAVLRKTHATGCVVGAVSILAALIPRVDSRQIKRGWDALIPILGERRNRETNESGQYVFLFSGKALSTLSLHLQPAQVDLVLDALIRVLPESPYMGANDRAIKWLAPRLNPQQAKRAFIACTAELREGRAITYVDSNSLAALVSKLDQQELRRVIQEVMSRLKSSSVGATAEFAGVASRVEKEDVERAFTLLISRAKNSDASRDPEICEGLKALSARLDAGAIQLVASEFIAMIERSPNIGAGGITTLAPRLTPTQASEAWHALLAVMQTRALLVEAWGSPAVGDGLAALAPRLCWPKQDRPETLSSEFWRSQSRTMQQPATLPTASRLAGYLRWRRDSRIRKSDTSGVVCFRSEISRLATVRIGLGTPWGCLHRTWILGRETVSR